MRFSIIVVCLNAGEKLNQTLDSILSQTYAEYEIVVKDGGSSDGSIEGMRRDPRIRLFREADKGIYDAMNQAVAHAEGEFLLFLNCGDLFYDEKVLERTAEAVKSQTATGADMNCLVLYGDTYSARNQAMIASAGQITGLTCYRNIPCHQSCFYSAALCKEKPYDLQYRIRADYDHFLWCYYVKRARMIHMGFAVSSYEGGGVSESRENRERDQEEHKQITSTYMEKGDLLRYRLFMLCTLAPLRRLLAEGSVLSGGYHWLKERLYRRKLWILAAVLLFVVELALLLWPVGWLGEEKKNFLAGEGSWVLEQSGESATYCQEFVPEYKKLKSIGVVIETYERTLGTGEMSFVVSDDSDQILFAQNIPYNQLSLESYEDITVNLLLEQGKKYYLTVNCVADEAGVVPFLKVCGTEYYMPENNRLIGEDIVDNTQLLTRYIYEDAISKGDILKALLLCFVTALGVAIGLPENKKFRRVVGVLLLIAGPYVLGQRLELLTVNPAIYYPFSMAWNVGLMYMLELIILLCTRSVKVSICVSNVLLTLVYTANYYVFSFRGAPLRMNELAAIRTAASVVARYDLRPNSHLAMAWCILLFFLVYGIQVGVKREKQSHMWKKRVIFSATSLIAGITIALISGYVLLYTDFLLKCGFMDLHGFDQNLNYQLDGYLVAGMLDIQASRVSKPEGYSIETLETLLKEAEQNHETLSSEGQVQPHVILIMNESFSDLRVLGNLQLSQENLPFINSLKENTVRGYVNASVLGGGTANSEFEVFTGSSMGFLPVSYYPYQQCLIKPIPSLVSNMEEMGYTTYSIHPHTSVNWSRGRVYELLGFDHSLWIEDFEGAETLNAGVSDLETYRKVEELFENREEGEKLFIFDLTMQNHGGYTGEVIEKTVTALNVFSDEADIYLSLIQESDRAFEQLVTYFEQQDEPVIICMYGDHQPMMTEGNFYEEIFSQTEGLTERDKTLNKYKVPFIIWANYDIPEQEGLDIGMSYLGALLLDVAEFPCSPYFSFLQQYMEDYPIITVNGYQDSEGNYYPWSKEGTELIEYRMLQYNHLFDNNIVTWGFLIGNR